MDVMAIDFSHIVVLHCMNRLFPECPLINHLMANLTDMPQMPETEPGKAYHWPTCANAALAYMNKHFFTSSNMSAEKYCCTGFFGKCIEQPVPDRNKQCRKHFNDQRFRNS